MSRSLHLNSRPLLTQLALSTLLILAIPCTYANSNNTSTYSDAVFAANAVKAPVAHDDDDSYSSYNYRGRYAQMSAEKQQLQKIAEEQKAQDAQVSSIQRMNESDADYQARMQKENNPVWLKHQAQVKLQAQIIAQQAEKQNLQAAGMTSNSATPRNQNNLPAHNLNKAEVADHALTTGELSALSFSPTHPPEISPDSIPREMSMGKYIGYSLFYLLGLVWSVIFFVGLMLRRNR